MRLYRHAHEKKPPRFLAAAFEFAEGSSTNHGRSSRGLCKTAAVSGGRFLSADIVLRRSVLGRPGSDLLFQTLRFSTIGAGEFYGRVRDGIGYRPPAKTTRPAKDV